MENNYNNCDISARKIIVSEKQRKLLKEKNSSHITALKQIPVLIRYEDILAKEVTGEWKLKKKISPRTSSQYRHHLYEERR